MTNAKRPKHVSLKGRPLPDLSSLGLSAATALTPRPLLFCLFDSEQRPSRRVVKSIAEQYDAIRKKKLSVLGLQAVPCRNEVLQSWKESNSLPFPVGCVSEEAAGAEWVKGVDSLPWLILTDAKGIVVDEGFSLDELEAKLGAYEETR